MGTILNYLLKSTESETNSEKLMYNQKGLASYSNTPLVHTYSLFNSRSAGLRSSQP